MDDDGWWHQQDLELMQLEQAAKQVFAIYLYLLLAQKNFFLGKAGLGLAGRGEARRGEAKKERGR